MGIRSFLRASFARAIYLWKKKNQQEQRVKIMKHVECECVGKKLELALEITMMNNDDDD